MADSDFFFLVLWEDWLSKKGFETVQDKTIDGSLYFIVLPGKSE